MSKLDQIERSVAALSDEELKSFADWFDNLRWQRWDRQLERDVRAGKLGGPINEARAEIEAGKTKPLKITGQQRASGVCFTLCRMTSARPRGEGVRPARG